MIDSENFGKIYALIVEPDVALAHRLLSGLPEDLKIVVEQCSTTRKAIQSLLQVRYQVCFVADSYPADEAESFLRDLAKIAHAKECLFVEVRDSVEADFDRFSLREQGYGYVISRTGSYADKEGLVDTLQKFLLHGNEIKRHIVNVKSSMSLALDAIDQAAEDVRRGRKPRLDSLAHSFIADQTQFDCAVLEEYFDNLVNSTESSKPNQVKELSVPKEVLDKALPKLSANTYNGVSRRVWKKLGNRFGKGFS